MPDWPVTWDILLFGSDQLSVQTNIQILSCVKKIYITNWTFFYTLTNRVDTSLILYNDQLLFVYRQSYFDHTSCID